MNIGFYGHSLAMYRANDPKNYIHKIKNYFDATLVNTGVAQCSEERILFSLKKTKKLDFAVIFHTPPYNLFVPSWFRDISTVDKDSFQSKMSIDKWIKDMNLTNDSIEFENIKMLMQSIPNGGLFQLLECLEIDAEDYMEEFKKWFNGDDTDILNVVREQAQKDSKHSIIEELWTAVLLRKKYLDHPDLQMNRYYGAFMQIDQYLKFKKIPCIHFLDKEEWYPNWWKIQSGVVNKDVQKLQYQTSPYYVGYHNSENALNEEGNDIIFNEIIKVAEGAGFEPAKR